MSPRPRSVDKGFGKDTLLNKDSGERIEGNWLIFLPYRQYCKILTGNNREIIGQ